MIEFLKKPYDIKKIRGVLNPLFERWFYGKFKEFSYPQQFSIYPIHVRENILVSAPTGSGKTLSAFGAVLNELVDSSQKGLLRDRIYCVYVSPLKALNQDIKVNLLKPLEEMNALNGSDLGIRVGVRTGDTDTNERARMLRKPPHILVTTPESLAIILASKKFSEHLRDINWCIIDEVHALAENKRGVYLSALLEMLERKTFHMSRVGLSATVAPLEKVSRFLVGKDRRCKVVDVQQLKKYELDIVTPVKDLINSDYESIKKGMYRKMRDLIKNHKTVLIFTNTRAATERLVHNLKRLYPQDFNDTNIGAHHGSLSKDHRLMIEQSLREGKLKCVVCSTSLELGIDIGFIDLVICLGSPKSVARALQRFGRSGHKLDATTKGTFIVTDRDDLVECGVLLKCAEEKKIDKIHIPHNSLDVLAQVIVGFSLDDVWDINELYKTITQSYCYENLPFEDFIQTISYLAGEYSALEDRNIYAKIWYNDGKIGKRGRLARVLYMTNLGTIPDSASVKVKIGDAVIGTVEESFLEKLRKGDVFVLGGLTYEFRFSRGMTAQVRSAEGKKPTVPAWFSEMLPLSFDLANEIGRFRRLTDEKMNKHSKKETVDFISEYLHIRKEVATAIYEYIKEQKNYATVPTDKKILVEKYTGEEMTKYIFHSIFGRRTNDCLSKAIAFSVSKSQHKDVAITLTDNGFLLSSKKEINVVKAFSLLEPDDLYETLSLAIEKSEVIKRRFRQVAARALMILRSYKGIRKNVGRQYMSSTLLYAALKRIDDDFVILKETRREILEDAMDIKNAIEIVKRFKDNKIKLEQIQTNVPTPFSFNMVLQGISDLLKMESRQDFLRRMHAMVLTKIALNKGKKGEAFEFEFPESEGSMNNPGELDLSPDSFSYDKLWKKEEEKKKENEEEFEDKLKRELSLLVRKKKLDPNVAYDIFRLIEGDKKFKEEFIGWLGKFISGTIPKQWGDEMIKFLKQRYEEIK